VAVAISFSAFLVILGLGTVTGPAVAQRVIARGLPTLLQTDELLSLHRTELRGSAQSSGGQLVTLPGFPVDARWTQSEVTKDSPQTLVAVLDARAAAAVYQRGPAAFAAAGGHGVDVTGPLLSGPWVLHQIFLLLSARSHAHLAKLSLLGAALVLLFLTLLCLQVDSYGRLVGVGISGLCGALLAGLATIFLWLVVQLYAGGASSPVSLTAWGMAADGLWIMVLLDAVAVVACAAMAAAGLAFAALERKASRRHSPPLSFARVARRRPLG